MAYDENGSYTGDGFVGVTIDGVSNESIDGYINPILKLENITSTSAINVNQSYNGEKFIGWKITIADLTSNSLVWFGLAATEKIPYILESGEETLQSVLMLSFNSDFN